MGAPGQGVDVWVKHSRRPWEASGTSGMKVLVNGGLNLSELGRWWAEAYSRKLAGRLEIGANMGMTLPGTRLKRKDFMSTRNRGYPRVLSRDKQGISRGWVARMRESMARLTRRFRRIGSPPNIRTTLSLARRLFASAPRIEVQAETIWRLAAELANIGQRCIRHSDRRATGDRYLFHVQVFLDDIDPDALRVELYASSERQDQISQTYESWRALVGATNALPTALCPKNRPVCGLYARLVPQHLGAFVPLEPFHSVA